MNGQINDSIQIISENVIQHSIFLAKTWRPYGLAISASIAVEVPSQFLKHT